MQMNQKNMKIFSHPQEQSPLKKNQKNENHSLSADIATGWRPRMKVIGPMPLNFDNPIVDKMIETLLQTETSMFAVIYLGIRPTNTFKMHEYLANGYRFKYKHLLNADYSHLKPFWKKFYSEFEPETKRPFIGMNPKLKEDLLFDSCFESGNLDAVVKVKNNEYDLILRVDSNTAGHIMWFNFKVRNQKHTKTKIKFNIVNLRRTKIFYQNTLRPYIKRKGQEWKQGGQNVCCKDDRISFDRSYISISNAKEEEMPVFRKLSFEIEFYPQQQMQFAYSIPYTYSQLEEDIKEFKKISTNLQGFTLETNYKNQSLSGIQIPYLHFEYPSNQTKKDCFVIIARQHPGEANSSHVMKGIILGILKAAAEQSSRQLMKSFVFHIIPMINPDGVVMGNFRTSLYGKDLNRLFSKSQTLMIPEVEFCRSLMNSLWRKHKNRLAMFLDIHGHSVRRNSFCYGPGIGNANSFQDARKFPKIISQINQIFRFQSCSFRIARQKKSTARAIFSRLAGLCYTIQTSNWSYLLPSNRNIFLFNENKWNEIGEVIPQSIVKFIQNIKIRKKNNKIRRESLHQKIKKEVSFDNRTHKVSPQRRIQLRTLVSDKVLHKIESSDFINQHSQIKLSIKNERREKYFSFQRQQNNKSEREKTDKSEQSFAIIAQQQSEAQDSDQSEQQDMESQKFKKYINVASKMFIQFQKAYYGEQYQQRKNINLNKIIHQTARSKKKNPKQSQQPCLRMNVEQKMIEQNQQRYAKKVHLKAFTQNQAQLSSVKKKKTLFHDPRAEMTSSLPRINILNYVAYVSQEKKQTQQNSESLNHLRVPKIINTTKNVRKK